MSIFEIKHCKEQDISQLFDMFKNLYKANPNMQKKAYFDWQYKDSPFSSKEEYNFLIQKEDDAITGFLGYVPIEFRYEKEIHQGCWLYNWHSNCQGVAGLRLLLHIMEKYDNLFLYGMTPMAMSIYSRFQIPMISEMSRYLGIIDKEFVVSFFECEQKQDMHTIETSAISLGVYKDIGEITSVERFDPEGEYCFNEWQDIKGYSRRTGRFLNWRFIDIPDHNYKCIKHSDGGYAVYRIESIMNHNRGVTRLIEWNFKNDKARQALAFIINDSKKYRSILIDFFSTARDIGKDLEKLGFINECNMKKRLPYLFRPLKQKDGIAVGIDRAPHNAKRNINFDNWYITSADGDMDRIKL